MWRKEGWVAAAAERKTERMRVEEADSSGVGTGTLLRSPKNAAVLEEKRGTFTFPGFSSIPKLRSGSSASLHPSLSLRVFLAKDVKKNGRGQQKKIVCSLPLFLYSSSIPLPNGRKREREGRGDGQTSFKAKSPSNWWRQRWKEMGKERRRGIE